MKSMDENKAVKTSDSGDVSTVEGENVTADVLDRKSRKTALPIPEVQLSSKVKIALDTRETINNKRDIDGLLKNKPRNVVCGDKSIVSYEPKVETTSITHDSKKSSPIEITQDKQLEQYSSRHNVQERDIIMLSDDIDAEAHNTVIDVDDCSIEDSDGIRFSQSVVDFKDVKSFSNFNIVVNGLIIDSEIPEHLRVKYYELCCSQKSYLHDQLIDGLNLKLAVGVIFETINIADAIRSSKLQTACSENLKIWDKTLKAFMDLGMKVGFLRARIDKLLTVSHNSEDAIKHSICKKVKAEEQLEALEMKIISVKDEIENLDSEIEAMKMKGEAEFIKEAKAPW